jgi:hypothetical protein
MPTDNWRDLYSSGYLKAADLPPDGLVVAITGIVEKEFDGTRKLVAQVDNDKGWVLNFTNCELLAEIFGSDASDEWRGKVRLVNDMTVRGPSGERGGIRVRKLKKKRKKTAPAVDEDMADIDDDLADLDDES